MAKVCYLRLYQRVIAKQKDVLRLGDLAKISASPDVVEKLRGIVVHQISSKDKNILVIEMMRVIDLIRHVDEQLEVQTIGPNQTIVEIRYPRKQWSVLSFVAVWLLLFFGAGLAIMNFHEDVSMQAVQQKLYKMITGEEVEKPLLLQIPYSLGLGIGMVLFFNHLFKKRFNEEPSPLEVEMFKYQQDLDQYIVIHENKESMNRIDDN
ncbi:stage V sporulation protein AA [Bacillus tianshenii]|nr:stage V sporulation protein AA [Bacillus tianshenii]